MENEIMGRWKKNCVRIGAPTNLLAAATAFLPVLWLCYTYDCWPALDAVLMAWSMVALSFGAFYFVEPVSYYAALVRSVSFLCSLSGKIGTCGGPVVALVLLATYSLPVTIQAEVSSTMAICGSIITNLVFTTMAAVIGAAVVAILPVFIVNALTKYAAAAIFGGTFGNFAIKYPKVAVFALGLPLAVRLTVGAPAWLLIVISVFGSLAAARFFYVREHKAA